MVRRKIQHVEQVFQGSTPLGHLTDEDAGIVVRPTKCFLLPQCEIHVLDGQGRKGWAAALEPNRVCSRKIPPQWRRPLPVPHR
jgi:hypothetical protein